MADLATFMTRACIAALDEGRVPTWGGVPRSRPSDPTPIYDQLRDETLVPIPRARRTDPPTSHDAARTVSKITETHDRLLLLLTAAPGDGATDEHLAAMWNRRVHSMNWPLISPSGLRSRRHELVQMGKVVDSGQRAKTTAGRTCTVWRLA